MSTPGAGAEPLTLLRTKLHKPQFHPDWVRRPRLVKRLKQGLHREPTLVSAPAGLGKSTLEASSPVETDHDATWLSLDEGGNDPVRIFIWGWRDRRFMHRVDSPVNLHTCALSPSTRAVLTRSVFRAILINTIKNTHIGGVR